MESFIRQPNDKLFKQAMADIRVAREMFESRLPKQMLKKINLDTLTLEKHSFIDNTFKTTEADVVYSVQLKSSKRKAYLYLLCENQSNVDQMMAFRLLKYTVRIMELHQKQYPKGPLPIVYPMIIYIGEKKWNAPRDIFDLFGEYKELARQILFQPYQLIDVQRMDDENVIQHCWWGLVEYVFKYRKDRDFERFLDTIFPWLCRIEIYDGEDYAKIVLRYVTDGVEEGKRELLLQKTNHLSQNLRSEIMTIAKQWEQEGFEKGKREGLTIAKQWKQEGRQEGLEQGMKKMARKLLAKGISLAEVQELTELPLETLKKLQAEQIDLEKIDPY